MDKLLQQNISLLKLMMLLYSYPILSIAVLQKILNNCSYTYKPGFEPLVGPNNFPGVHI